MNAQTVPDTRGSSPDMTTVCADRPHSSACKVRLSHDRRAASRTKCSRCLAVATNAASTEASLSQGVQVAINKVTWQKVGRVTEPGRYMFTFGWLNIAAEDLAIWQQFPDAAFTLVRMPAADDEDEYHLGAFELPEHPAPDQEP
jgi:hypothetical protein